MPCDVRNVAPHPWQSDGRSDLAPGEFQEVSLTSACNEVLASTLPGAGSAIISKGVGSLDYGCSSRRLCGTFTTFFQVIALSHCANPMMSLGQCLHHQVRGERLTETMPPTFTSKNKAWHAKSSLSRRHSVSFVGQVPSEKKALFAHSWAAG